MDYPACTDGIIVTVQNKTAQDVMDHGDMPGLIAACVIFNPAGQWAGWLFSYGSLPMTCRNLARIVDG